MEHFVLLAVLASLALAAALPQRLSRYSDDRAHEELAAALGREHVAAHFTSHRHASAAIAHEETLIAGSSGGSFAVASCTSYHADGSSVMSALSNAGVPTHLTYTSAQEKKLCFVSSLERSGNGHSTFFSESIQSRLDFVAVVPSVLKMDRSVALVLDWFGGSSVGGSRVGGLSATSHPILRDIESGQPVTLSVVVRHDWSRSSRDSKFSLSETDLDTVAPLWDRIYWSSRFAELDESALSPHSSRKKLWQRWRDSPRHSASCVASRHKSFGTSSDGQTSTIELEIPSEHLTSANIHCFTRLLVAVLAKDGVSRVALGRPMRLLNNYARGLVQSGKILQEPLSAVGLDGSGQVVGIADTGIDENSCFFRDDEHGFVPLSSVDNPVAYHEQRKIVQYLNYSGSGGDIPDGHGSHVAGSVAGACIDPSYPDMAQYDGMAKGAKIAFFDIMDDTTTHLYVPSDLAKSMFRPSYTAAGARLYSNSWGGSYWYDAFAVEVDDFSYKNSDFLAIFAAGNDGSNGLRTVLSPAMSKNAMAVAASFTGHSATAGQDSDSLASFSAKGPAPDGRIKPDIAVPGAAIYSTKSNRVDRDNYRSESSQMTCAVEPKAGTSMAAPVCAGSAALVRQYFSDPLFWAAACNSSYPLCLPSGFSPQGYLVKAVLISGAQDMRSFALPDGELKTLGHGPDFYQGYGRLSLSTVLPLQRYIPMLGVAGLDLFVDDGLLRSFTQARYEAHVVDPLVPLRASLCWYDPPNQEFAARVLLHDLDLVLVDPTGQQRLYGNSASRSGQALMGGRRDELNTCEQVTVSAPQAGSWTVLVQSKLLTQADSQAFAIVVTQAGSVQSLATSEPVSPSEFDACHSSPFPGTGDETEPLLMLDLALFSLPLGNGWNSSAGESFVLVPDGSSSASTHSNPSSSAGSRALTGSMIARTVYERQSLCLYPGCYQIALQAANNGTLLGIPLCDQLLLSPLSPFEAFCLKAVETGYGYSQAVCVRRPSPAPQPVPAIVPTPAPTPSSAVQVVAILIDDGGAGWDGGYFTVRPYPDPAAAAASLVSGSGGDPSQASTASFQATAAGTMVWGFENPLLLRLPMYPSSPASGGCHMLKLTMPPGADAEPLVFFDNSFALNADGSLQDWSGDATSDQQLGGKALCRLYANVSVAFVSICVPEANVAWKSPATSAADADAASTVAVDLTFFRTSAERNATTALQAGSWQTQGMWQHYSIVTAATNLTSIGSCRIAANKIEWVQPDASDVAGLPTRRPAPAPTPQPSVGPTSPRPPHQPPATTSPSPFPQGKTLECFSTCPHFLAATSFPTQPAAICSFLLEHAFPTCGSFALANSQCPRPVCAASCTDSDWCFFGAAAVSSCKFEQGQGFSLTDPDAGFTPGPDAIAITAACLKTAVAGNHSLPAESSFESDAQDSGTAPLSNEAMFLLTVFQIAALWILLHWLRGSFQGRGAGGQRSGGSSQHQESGEQSSGSPDARGAGEEGGGGNNSPHSGSKSYWRGAIRWGWGWGGSSARHTRLADDSGHSLSLSSSGGSTSLDASNSSSIVRPREEDAATFSPVHNKAAFSIVSSEDDDQDDEG